MNRKEKDRLRALKREIKRSGNKKVRSRFKKDLENNPEDAHLAQVDYGGSTSKKLNGIDHDATRKKKTHRQLYNEANSGIIAQTELKHEELSTMRLGKQANSQGVPELCSSLLGHDPKGHDPKGEGEAPKG